MSGLFNDIVQTDLFMLFKCIFAVFIDECSRYKQIQLVSSKSGKDHVGAFLRCWMRIFGPPRVLGSDQEGGLSSLESAAELERVSAIRRLKVAEVEGRYIGTGLAEIHVKLSRLAMRKIKAECELAGLTVSDEDIGYEA